ncbi:hypothetical protein PLEOSDRAFT_1114448 [Pleurotus ostreatus PC15]|uniref:DNA endonuclease activator Ctp1 C-terminal domain-containing protein n=1 Tax=Pleurotus ostreatus (strain PC15) TaxID=1137138 RepID=A0A067N931_PLEO1|nr:hypothetical protein PLEOSDRAFT_1114448 [Pleurotus ostreatus PC15]
MHLPALVVVVASATSDFSSTSRVPPSFQSRFSGMETGNTFSSANLRVRDKIVEEKHQKELADIERKLTRCKATNDDLLKQLFDARHRGEHLASLLGFPSLMEAQVYIENADEDMTYKERSDRMTDLQRQLKAAQAAVDESANVREEVESLKRSLAESRAEVESLKSGGELAILQKRYDRVVDSMDRASKRYARDYRAMDRVRKYLACTDAMMDSTDPHRAELQQKRLKGFSKNELQKLIDMLANGTNPAALDKHLGIVHAIPHRQTPQIEPTSSLRSSQTRVAQSHSPQSKLPPSSPSPHDLPAHSSDTESDSQALEPFAATLFRKGGGPSSDTEDDSQMPSATNLSPAPVRVATKFETPNYTSRPFIPRTVPHETRTSPTTSHLQRRPNTEAARPSKVRRTYAEDVSANMSSTPIRAPDRSTRAPLKDKPLVRIMGNEKPTPDSAPLFKGKGKATEGGGATTPTPSAPARNGRLTDYSAYKGRGRYAQPAQSSGSSKPINTLFAIDPKRNGGLDFQFEEVVKNKEDRKKLHAGDCECCRDYYEAVGPLPPRPQPPLWRSPESTPTAQRHRASSSNTSPDSRIKTIDRHKQAISRHRQQWVRGRTPPGYWNIGFPSTQEANDISNYAEDMHRRKQEEIEKEARKENGRYKRRDRDW